ncbi:MAG: hypothetical protein DWH72_00890 [Planctomycetota bacterium]|nr:MAG: hypothetical protein DWH72_00890 [Planctomycetota bacterium]
MILINKGESNIIDLTLTERVTLAVPVFLFRFVNDITNVEFACIMANTSIYKDRYDRFTFIEGTTLTLNPTGFYHYYVYEQVSNVNLDYTLAGDLLEVGKLRVVTTAETQPITEFTAPNTYKAFEYNS